MASDGLYGAQKLMLRLMVEEDRRVNEMGLESRQGPCLSHAYNTRLGAVSGSRWQHRSRRDTMSRELERADRL
jgi:hypothetical protein